MQLIVIDVRWFRVCRTGRLGFYHVLKSNIKCHAVFFFPDPALGFQGQLDKLEQLRKEIPNAHVLDQFANAANPEAHFRWTGSTDLCTGASDLIRE